MKPARATTPGASRYLSSGPLVWVATMVCTTLLLVALKQALWLVVPFLLAIILYYALFPAVRRMTLAGVERETAAAFVSARSARRGGGGDGADACRGSRRRPSAARKPCSATSPAGGRWSSARLPCSSRNSDS